MHGRRNGIMWCWVQNRFQNQPRATGTEGKKPPPFLRIYESAVNKIRCLPGVCCCWWVRFSKCLKCLGSCKTSANIERPAQLFLCKTQTSFSEYSAPPLPCARGQTAFKSVGSLQKLFCKTHLEPAVQRYGQVHRACADSSTKMIVEARGSSFCLGVRKRNESFMAIGKGELNSGLKNIS